MIVGDELQCLGRALWHLTSRTNHDQQRLGLRSLCQQLAATSDGKMSGLESEASPTSTMRMWRAKGHCRSVFSARPSPPTFEEAIRCRHVGLFQ